MDPLPAASPAMGSQHLGQRVSFLDRSAFFPEKSWGQFPLCGPHTAFLPLKGGHFLYLPTMDSRY